MRISIIFLLLSLIFPHLAQARELQVAVGSPHERAAQPGVGGKRSALVAFNEDLAREICRRISARCTVVFMTFGEILPGIQANKVALGFGNFLRTPAREKGVAFSDSIWRSFSRLVTTRAVAQHFATEKGTETRLDSLRQARVVGVPETQQYAYLQRLSSANGLTLISAKTYRDAFSLLREGQADFFLLPTLSGYLQLAQAEGAGFEFFGPPEVAHGLGGTVHIALPKTDEALRDAVNQAIAEARADGTYHRIVRRHFPFSLE